MTAVAAGQVGRDAGRHALTAVLEAAGEALRAATNTDLADASTATLTDAFDRLTRLERMLTAVRARVVCGLERRDAAAEVGAVDTVALLKDRGRLSGRDAKRAVELGRRLEDLPRTAAALAEGEVGVEQAEQIARAARRGRLGDAKLVEGQLLEAATTATPEELRDEVKRREHAADGELLLRDERAAYRRRSLRRWRNDDGMMEGHFVLDAVSAEYVDTMLRAFEAPDAADTPIELRRSPDQRAADALVQAAKVALDAGEAPDNGGEKPHIGVVVPAETLARRGDGPPAEAQWGGPISTQALYRFLCDAGIGRIVAGGASQLLDLGRSTRTWSGVQRRGIIALDGHCRFPGCDRPAAWTDIHHVRWWERDRGRTDISNGCLLCVRHHHTVHEGGWKLTMDPDSRVVTVVSPDGRTRLTSRPRGIIPRLATTTRPTP